MPGSLHSVILLAGGAGTRLQSVTGSTPKCLAPVDGQPFLYHLLQRLSAQGFQHFVLALGIGASEVERAVAAWQQYHPHIRIDFSIETTPLGTGGAVLQALSLCKSDDVLILNADSYLDGSFAYALHKHQQYKAVATVLLSHVQHADRYGLVQVDAQHRIVQFHEKQAHSSGLINAGAYWLNRQRFDVSAFPASCSWEKIIMPHLLAQAQLYGVATTGYFIDIGIPEDYAKAQTDFAHSFPMLQPDKSWTLFLDRDGVINIEKVKDYIHHWDEFQFYPDAVESIAAFSKIFSRIIIVTNQKGVGKGVTLQENLDEIHQRMTATIVAAGGRIDAIYYCPDTDDNSPNRKPNPGMASQAKADFPEIVFSRSIMVGNNTSDLYFARNAGMHAVFLRSTQPDLQLPPALADMESPSLSHLAQVWQRQPIG